MPPLTQRIGVKPYFSYFFRSGVIDFFAKCGYRNTLKSYQKSIIEDNISIN